MPSMANQTSWGMVLVSLMLLWALHPQAWSDTAFNGLFTHHCCAVWGEESFWKHCGVLLHLEINYDKFQNMTCGDHLPCLTIHKPPCVINTTSASCALHIIFWEPLMKPHVCLPFTCGYKDPESLSAFVPSYPASVPGSFCSLLL